MDKKILFVTYGDSTSPKAWSNIPFLLSENLAKKGFQIERLNIMPNETHEKRWKKYIERPLNRVFKHHQYAYIRTPFFKNATFSKIKEAVHKNPNLYFTIFLNFEFYNKFSKTPSLLLGDWTYDTIIFDRLKRQPYFFEKWFINYQCEAIQNAEIVISLFKDARDNISKRYKKNAHHLGINVVNDLNFNPISENEIIARKINSQQFLMIGSMKYIQGARKLVDAFRILSSKYSSIQLNIVGIDDENLSLTAEDKNIHTYNYLQKDDAVDNKTYYDLMVNARAIVNPSELWAAYSSTIEAMKYFTPVIIKPYEAFVNDFGNKNDFGIYLENTEVTTVVDAIESILNMDNESYTLLCKKSNELVKDYSWENYTDKIITLMEEITSKETT